MACITYNCENEFGEHTPVNCEEYPQGGSDQLITLQCGHSVTDPSSEAQINAAITAGEAQLITNIRLNIPEASPVLVTPPVGCSTDKVVTYDRSVIWQDGNVSQANQDGIYDPLAKGAPIDSIIVYECSEDRVRWLRPDKSMRGTVTFLLPESETEFQMYTSTVTYRSLAMGTIHAAPPNIFN